MLTPLIHPKHTPKPSISHRNFTAYPYKETAKRASFCPVKTKGDNLYHPYPISVLFWLKSGKNRILQTKTGSETPRTPSKLTPHPPKQHQKPHPLTTPTTQEKKIKTKKIEGKEGECSKSAPPPIPCRSSFLLPWVSGLIYF